MKKSYVIFCLLFVSTISKAELLRNCFSERDTKYFSYELEEIAQKGWQPILLFNESRQVVGVMPVSAKRNDNYPHFANYVRVEQLSLCSSLEVDMFYYTQDNDNLLDWVQMPEQSAYISQDEGKIELSFTSIESDETYGRLIKAHFFAYDVFNDPEEVVEKETGWQKDWGNPVGEGNFYFFMPSNWTNK